MRTGPGSNDEDFSGVVHLAGDDDEEPVTIAMGLAEPGRRVAEPPGDPLRNRLDDEDAHRADRGPARRPRRRPLRGSPRRPASLPTSGRRDLDERVTLHHLLSHTSGRRRLRRRVRRTAVRGRSGRRSRRARSAAPGPGPPIPRPAADLRSRARRRATTTAPTSSPGSRSRRSPGDVVPGLVRDEVFEPLGMTSSGFWALDDPSSRISRSATCRRIPRPARARSAPAWRTNIHAHAGDGPARRRRAGDGGGSRPRARWRCRGAARRSRLPTAGDADADDRAARDQPGREGVGYGLGVITAGSRPTARIGHAGEDPGFSSRCWVYVATGRAGRRPVERDRGAWQPFKHLEELLAAAG